MIHSFYWKRLSFMKVKMKVVNVLARWWPRWCWKCDSGLRQLEKKSKFLRCIQVWDLKLTCCSVMNEGNWIQHLFYFLELVNVVASFIGKSFFICGLGFRLKFSPNAVIRKRLQLESKTELTTFLQFSGQIKPNFVSLKSAWTKISKNCSIMIVFWQYQSFLMVWGVVWSVL